MAEVHRLPNQRREFITDGDRAALRATWHTDSGYVVVSLWHGDTCVATSHLTPGEAGRLSRFITSGLVDLAMDALDDRRSVTQIQPRVAMSSRFRRAVKVWRQSLAWSLESIARRLR